LSCFDHILFATAGLMENTKRSIDITESTYPP